MICSREIIPEMFYKSYIKELNKPQKYVKNRTVFCFIAYQEVIDKTDLDFILLTGTSLNMIA